MSAVREHIKLLLASPRTYLRYVRGLLLTEAVAEATTVRIEIAKQAVQRTLTQAAHTRNPQDTRMDDDSIDRIAKVSVLSRWLSTIALRLLPVLIALPLLWIALQVLGAILGVLWAGAPFFLIIGLIVFLFVRSGVFAEDKKTGRSRRR